MIEVKQGYYSLLRWRRDPARDECHNVAVILVSRDGRFGGIRPAPISSISNNIRQQGILDAVIQGLAQQFDSEVKPDVAQIADMSATLEERSLVVTEPVPAAVTDPQSTLDALYKALVQPSGGYKPQSKGAVLDRVVNSFRRRGYTVTRGEYFDDFLFDAIIAAPRVGNVMIDVLSFTSGKRNWTGEKKDAGHFLYGLQRVNGRGLGVIASPTQLSANAASVTYERIMRWFEIMQSRCSSAELHPHDSTPEERRCLKILVPHRRESLSIFSVYYSRAKPGR